MKKIILNLIVIVVSIIVANFLNRGCLYLVDKFNLFSDSSRLGILFIPFTIYAIVLFLIAPYIIKIINKKSEKWRNITICEVGNFEK